MVAQRCPAVMGIIFSILNLVCRFPPQVMSAKSHPQVYTFGGKMMLSINRTGGPLL